MAAWLAASGAQAQNAVATFKLLKLDGYYVKWGAPKVGAGATVTYALVEQPMQFAEARNCGSVAPVTGLLHRSNVSKASFVRAAREAFRQWEEAADLRFEAADDPANADILIGAQGVPVGRAFTNVAYRETESGPVRSIKQALICLNPQQLWKIGFGGSTEIYDLRHTIAHEVGHAIGLDHPSPFGQVMSFRYDEQVRGLQDGDVSGAATLYGPPQGPVLTGAASKPAAVAPPQAVRHARPSS